SPRSSLERSVVESPGDGQSQVAFINHRFHAGSFRPVPRFRGPASEHADASRERIFVQAVIHPANEADQNWLPPARLIQSILHSLSNARKSSARLYGTIPSRGTSVRDAISEMVLSCTCSPSPRTSLNSTPETARPRCRAMSIVISVWL